MRGKLITFEGFEGSGKSTQIRLIFQYLKKKRFPVIFLREPGGVSISEKIRKILLNVKNQKMGKECETLLYMASRAQLVKQVIMPSLKKGKIILCDRFLDSTIAYQGYGHGIDIELIKKIGLFATQGIKPDLTFIFNINVNEGLSRIKRPKDRIEKRSLMYHRRVQQGYLKLVSLELKRMRLIQGNGTKKEIFEKIKNHIDHLLAL